MKTLADAFHHTLQDVYFAEHSLITALPKVIKAVSQPGLKRALQTHLAETKQHVTTLERVFASVGQKATGEKCDAIEGLIKECDGVVAEATGTAARHAAVLGCCQAIEHYEIARYGRLREWAKTLGNSEAHELPHADPPGGHGRERGVATSAAGLCSGDARGVRYGRSQDAHYPQSAPRVRTRTNIRPPARHGTCSM